MSTPKRRTPDEIQELVPHVDALLRDLGKLCDFVAEQEKFYDTNSPELKRVMMLKGDATFWYRILASYRGQIREGHI